jgi:hypothetical protein
MLQMMSAITGWSAFFTTLYSALTVESRILDFLKFLQLSSNNLHLKIVLLIFLGTLGQVCLYSMIRDFGALPCSFATTIRKVVTLVWMAMLDSSYSAKVGVKQWFGIVLVGSVISADIYYHNEAVQKKIKLSCRKFKAKLYPPPEDILNSAH